MKNEHINGYTISANRWKIQRKQVMKLLSLTYWANQRSELTVRKSIRRTYPFGLYDPQGKQVGFARVLTDGATTFYLADAILAEEARGKGLGLALVRYIMRDDRFRHCRGLLITQTAHGLYEKIGFQRVGDRLMMREPDPVTPR